MFTGQKFAMLEIKALASKVLRKYEIVRSNPTHVLLLSAETILKSANGLHIALRERDA